MNIVFISLSRCDSLDRPGIYPDLLRRLAADGHTICTVSAVERRCGEKTSLITEGSVRHLRVRTLNLQKCGLIEKGIGTLLLESQFLRAIRKYYADVHFDRVVYPTPPITLVRPAAYLKKRDGAQTYLLLKDIFPQNAVDLGMMSPKSPLYRFFRRKEKRLYSVSDHIGCMSPANVRYLLEHNPEVPPEKTELFPNSVQIRDLRLSAPERAELRRRYGLPEDKRIFVFGGNLGRPQGIPFLMECLRRTAELDGAYFLIVGGGTEYSRVETFMQTERPRNVRLMRQLPCAEYDRLAAACDIGLIFLDHRFTIPNFPSRLLSCLQAGLPVLAVTDPVTDLGRIVTEGGFGWWCESNSAEEFYRTVNEILAADLTVEKQNAFTKLTECYDCADYVGQITERSEEHELIHE